MKVLEYYVYDNLKKDVKFYDSINSLFKFIKSACFDNKWNNNISGIRRDWWWTLSTYSYTHFFEEYGHCLNDKKRFMVKDKYDRILNKKDLLKQFSDWDKPVEVKKKRWIRFGKFVFRRGPVKGIHNYRKGHWTKYSRNKASRAAMKRQWFRDDIYRIEVLEEFGVTFKMDRKEYHHNTGAYTKSWKRSKVKKQYLRNLSS